MKIVRYNDNLKNEWNQFLSKTKNYHFFFHRDFLAYHEGRFEDHSLLIYNDKDKLIALLPANINNDTLYTHQGLTYGGFLVDDNSRVEIMLDIFETTKEYLKRENIKRVIYKAIPHFHHTKPAQEDLYALFIQNAKLIQRDVSTIIELQKPITYSRSRKWSIKKVKNEGLLFQQSDEFEEFWELLKDVLKNKHNTKPVHSLEEIRYLHSKFPKNIKLFLTKKDDELLAGTLIFENPEVAHLQYVANSENGRKIGALDFLLDNLIQNIYKNRLYFDFGTSNEENGRVLNRGLVNQKERFGARAIAIDRYEWVL